MDAYVENFRPDLMEVVAAWVRGVKFAELAKMTSIFEVGVGRWGRGVREVWSA